MTRDLNLALIDTKTEVMQCSVCGEMIWKHRTDPITVRMSLTSHPWPSGQTYGQAVQLMAASAEELHLETVAEAGQAARAHFQKRHRIRFWIWERFGWDRVLWKWFR